MGKNLYTKLKELVSVLSKICFDILVKSNVENVHAFPINEKMQHLGHKISIIHCIKQKVTCIAYI